MTTVLLEIRDRIARVVLNRPAQLNAVSPELLDDLEAACAAAVADPTVKVLTITGAGRAFCVGADSRALEGHIAKGRYDSGTTEDIAKPGYGVRPEFDTDFAYHFGLTKPVIAAINGPAAGIGLVLACYADLRFASARTKLTTAHGKLNLPAEYGLSWLLPRMIGLTRANDLLLTSRVVLAEEALTMGLVNTVVPPEELLPYTYNYVRAMITTVSPGSLRESKRQIYRDLHRDVRAAIADSVALVERMVTEPDFTEGVAALVEKRLPQWGK